MNFYEKPAFWILKKFIFQSVKKDYQKNYILNHTIVTLNETYTSSYPQNKFDVYTPCKKLENSPAVVWVHGGGLIGGDKSEVKEYALALSELGYTVFSLNYNLVPDSKYPEPIQQLSDFIVFLSSHTTRYKVDINNIFLAGNSAGAQIVSQFSVAQTNKQYSKRLSIQLPSCYFNIRGLLLFCGLYNFQDLFNGELSKLSTSLFKKVVESYFRDREWQSSPLTNTAAIYEYISSDFPPTYITDGNTFSLEKQSRKMLKYLKNSSVAVIYRFFDKKDFNVMHDYQFRIRGEPGKSSFADVKLFLENTRKK